MRRARRYPARRGAILVEGVVVVFVFLLLIMGILDLGITVFRYHVVYEAARSGARWAMVHGATATSTNVRDHIEPLLDNGGISAANVSLVFNPSGKTAPGNQVVVTVSVDYSPIFSYIFGNTPIHLSSTSQMYITN